jgi:hypothetical protein
MNTNRHPWVAALLIFNGLLILVPLIVLGSAINWPASLDEPASVNLPLIVEQAGAVRLGYLVYLIYSVLFVPLGLAVVWLVAKEGRGGVLLQTAAGFAVASGVMRTIGILRWLLPMPILANRYVDPTTDEATRAAITVIYDMLNSFAGGLGEVIGVGFFAALWAALVAYVILRDGTMPRWLGVFGLVVAVLLTAGLGEIFGIDVGILLTLNVVLLHFWWWAMAAVLLLRPRLVHA